MTTPLIHPLAEYEYLREHLLALYQEVDAETLEDTLDGISSLPEALAAWVRSYLDDLALVAALGIRIAEMQERMHRIEYRADKKRMTVSSVMEQADLKKLSQPDFTASLRAVPPALLVRDEQEIPEPFWKPQPPKLDRRAVLAALGAGQDVPGAMLGNGGLTLMVRTK